MRAADYGLLEIKESYKERLSESGDNSGLIVVIKANGMTLGLLMCKLPENSSCSTPSSTVNSACATQFKPQIHCCTGSCFNLV